VINTDLHPILQVAPFVSYGPIVASEREVYHIYALTRDDPLPISP